MTSLLRWGVPVSILIFGFVAATQYVAQSFGYHPELGEPIGRFLNLTFYFPWKILEWDMRFGKVYRSTFKEAWLILAPSIGLSFLSLGLLRGTRKIEKVSVTHGSARWAEDIEIKKAGLLNGGGVVLGLDKDGNYLRDDSDRHCIVTAPTRSGKGKGIVIPTLLSHKGSLICFDPKGENWEVTSGYRKRFSYVVYFNPADPRSAGFNCLLEIRKGVNEVKDAQNLADMIVDPDGKGNMDHWAKTAHCFLVGAILHVLYVGEEKSLAGVLRLLSNPKMTIEETLEMMMKAPHFADGSSHPEIVSFAKRAKEMILSTPNYPGCRTHQEVAGSARDMLNKSFDERSGVLSTAMVTLSVFRDPIVAAVTSRSDFAIDDFIKGDRPLSLYLVIPSSDVSRLRPLFRLIINQICKRLTETLEYDWKEVTRLSNYSAGRRVLHHLGVLPVPTSLNVRTRQREHRVLLLLDEFPVLGRLEFFESTLAYIAQYGLKALLISQSQSQLLREYGENNSIIDNCHIQVFHTPNGPRTAKYISDMLGRRTEQRRYRNFGGSRFGFMLGHVTEGENEFARALLEPDEVLRLSDKEQIMFVTSTPPIRCLKLEWDKDENFTSRICHPPLLPESGKYPYGPPARDNDWFRPTQEQVEPQSESHDEWEKDAPFYVTGKRRRHRPSGDQLELTDSKLFLGKA